MSKKRLAAVPAANTESNTMSTEITIAGRAFVVPVPYGAGHVLNDAEASQLNQVYHENIRNNVAAKIKKGAGQDEIDTYVSSYQFGMRTPGVGRTGDPVKREGLRLAETTIRQQLKAAGKLKTADPAKIKAGALRLFETNPFFRAKAEEIVADQKAAAQESLDLGDFTAAPAQAAE